MLTDYNRLADFVPNLEYCERVAGGPAGKQRLRQRACSQSLYWRLQAEAVLDVHEVHRSLGRRELHFTMVEGDFQVGSSIMLHTARMLRLRPAMDDPLPRRPLSPVSVYNAAHEAACVSLRESLACPQ